MKKLPVIIFGIITVACLSACYEKTPEEKVMEKMSVNNYDRDKEVQRLDEQRKQTDEAVAKAIGKPKSR